MPVYAFDPERTTNAQAIADAASLGLLDGTVLDATVGLGAFWSKWRPARLVTNDIDVDIAADLHADARALPFAARAFDVVVFDPPYAYRGTSRLASDRRYGLARRYAPAAEVDALLFAGTTEALRVARRYALVKCEDQAVSGRYRPQRHCLLGHAEGLGARVVGELHVYSPRVQPGGKRQCNVWASASTLVVLRPDAQHPRSTAGGAGLIGGACAGVHPLAEGDATR